jgi:hypothetical protein
MKFVTSLAGLPRFFLGEFTILSLLMFRICLNSFSSSLAFKTSSSSMFGEEGLFLFFPASFLLDSSNSSSFVAISLVPETI